MTETVEEFRDRARAWLAENMPPLERDQAMVGDDIHDRHRELQRRLWDGGFAGICFPSEYGGLGLPVEYQHAFTKESLAYEMPSTFNVPTFSILAATLLDFGSEEQKRRHIPAILRGEELWVQFLSEPTGGSDLAGCITRADRDGDVWILNGSKIWSSAAYASDYAMCLARTNWDVPKHRGLTMFLMKIHQPGVTVEQIEQVNGSMEFCQEFFDDVALPADAVIGEVNDGWTVATRLLLHERNAVGGGSQYTSGRTVGAEGGGRDNSLLELARRTGRAEDPLAQQLVAESHVLNLVSGHMIERLTSGMRSGAMPPASGSLLKLFSATSQERKHDIALELAGAGAAASSDALPDGLGQGSGYLYRQALCLGGGSNEIQRNIISERILGMPREWAADREVPYRDVTRTARPAGRA